MRLGEMSIAVVLTLGFDISAHSAPVAEQAELAMQAALMRAEVFGLETRQESDNFTFRLEEWLGDNGSGGFPADFTDESPRGHSWEEPPQY